MAISHVFSKTKKGVKCKPCDVGKLSFFSEADLDETGGAAHHKPLHRLYSYLRMAGARTLVREDALIPFGPMRDDDTARSLAGVLPKLQERYGGLLGRLAAHGGPTSLTSPAFLRERLPRAAAMLIARLEER